MFLGVNDPRKNLIPRDGSDVRILYYPKRMNAGQPMTKDVSGRSTICLHEGMPGEKGEILQCLILFHNDIRLRGRKERKGRTTHGEPCYYLHAPLIVKAFDLSCFGCLILYIGQGTVGLKALCNE